MMNKRKLKRTLHTTLNALHTAQLTESDHTRIRIERDTLRSAIADYLRVLDNRPTYAEVMRRAESLNGHAELVSE